MGALQAVTSFQARNCVCLELQLPYSLFISCTVRPVSPTENAIAYTVYMYIACGCLLIPYLEASSKEYIFNQILCGSSAYNPPHPKKATESRVESFCKTSFK